MSVERDRPRSAERARSEDRSQFKVFVGGISWHTSDQELADTFSKYSQKPVDARVMLDKVTGRSRGFGFVTFDNTEDMEECIAKLHATELDGRKISVTRAIPQSEIAPGAPASAIHGGSARGGGRERYRSDPYSRYDRSGGGYDRYDRGYGSRAYERPPPRGYDRGYERAPYPERGGYPERGYDRAGYPPEYDRGAYDRGYPPPSGYGRSSYDRAADPYGYPAKDPYARDPYGYEEAPPAYGYERGAPAYDRGAYSSAPGYDRPAAGAASDRYNGGDRYAPSERDPAYGGRSAAPAAAPRERSPNGAAYDRAPAAGGADPYGRAPGGPDRDYAARYGSSSRPRPYDRSAAPVRDDGRPAAR